MHLAFFDGFAFAGVYHRPPLGLGAYGKLPGTSRCGIPNGPGSAVNARAGTVGDKLKKLAALGTLSGPASPETDALGAHPPKSRCQRFTREAGAAKPDRAGFSMANEVHVRRSELAESAGYQLEWVAPRGLHPHHRCARGQAGEQDFHLVHLGIGYHKNLGQPLIGERFTP